MAAKASSYYCLTPASSTTSLNDLSNSIGLLENFNKANAKPQPTSSKKRARTSTSGSISASSLIEPRAQNPCTASSSSSDTVLMSSAPRRGRGRPPKQQQHQQLNAASQDKANTFTHEPPKELNQENQAAVSSKRNSSSGGSSLTRHNTIDVSTLASKNSNNKLIKSLINKSSSNSNLQKSKTSLNASAAASPSTLLVDKVNNQAYIAQQAEYQAALVANVHSTPIGQRLEPAPVPSKPKVDEYSESILKYYAQFKASAGGEEHEDAFSPMPKLNWANGADLWRVMRLKESKYGHDFMYMKRHQGIEPQMRSILLDWLVEISYAYRLHRETWHLALEYMDRFMSQSKQAMRVDRLQLIGLTCLFLAAKVEEIYPPKLKEFAAHLENYASDNEDAIQQFELGVLKTLGWEISPVTANTWLMTYLQIAAINYYDYLGRFYGRESEAKRAMNSHMVMPLHLYKNSNAELKDYLRAEGAKPSVEQQQFYLRNYMKSVTLLDLVMFDMDSLRFGYSVLAASALYLSLGVSGRDVEKYGAGTTSRAETHSAAHLNAFIVQECTGYKLYELDACIKWMYAYADVCKDVLTEEKMVAVKCFSNVDPDDAHNIQLYYQNLDLLVSRVWF